MFSKIVAIASIAALSDGLTIRSTVAGTIRAQYNDTAAAIVATMDTDKDGKISQHEFMQAIGNRAGSVFANRFADGDMQGVQQWITEQNAMTVAMIDAKRVVGDIANKLEIRAARNAGFEFTH